MFIFYFHVVISRYAINGVFICLVCIFDCLCDGCVAQNGYDRFAGHSFVLGE